MRSGKAVSSGVTAMLVLGGLLGTVLAVAGGAVALPAGCNVTIHGENGGDNAVQTAISAAHPGQTICLRAGVYPEQLTISTPGLRLIGAGEGKTIIAPTSGVVTTYDWDSAPTPHAPVTELNPLVTVVLVDNVSGVLLQGFTVNAAGAAASIDGCTPGLAGVDFQNVTSGSLLRVAVENAELSPSLLGCQFQTGIYAYMGYYDSGTVYTGSTVSIRSATITAYGKGGIVCDDPGLTCDISSTTVTGIGPTPAIAANGIQVAYGATGEIVSAKVSENDYTGPTATNDFYGNGYSSSGILLYLAGAGTTIAHSTLTDNQIGILAYDDAQDLIESNHIRNSEAYGIAEYGSTSTIVHVTGNTISNPATKSIGILVANGTFYLTGNHVAWTTASGDQGASQAVTGPGTVYPSATAESISTAAVQAISDGGPTTVYELGNTITHANAALATLSVFGGTVTIQP